MNANSTTWAVSTHRWICQLFLDLFSPNRFIHLSLSAWYRFLTPVQSSSRIETDKPVDTCSFVIYLRFSWANKMCTFMHSWKVWSAVRSLQLNVILLFNWKSILWMYLDFKVFKALEMFVCIWLYWLLWWPINSMQTIKLKTYRRSTQKWIRFEEKTRLSREQ